MTDLIERLRAGWGGDFTGGYATYEDLDQAAALLERQAALLEGAREAFIPILLFHETGGHTGDGSAEALLRARSVLKSLEAIDAGV